MGQGAAQAPLSFINVSVLRDTLVQLLGLVGGSSAEGAQPTVHGVGIGAQPAAAAPRVEVPPVPVIPQSVVAQPVMSAEEQKMLSHFLILTPPRFTGTPGEDVYQFLSSCKEKLRNLGLVESRGVDLVAYPFDTVARRWWRGYLDSRPVGSPPVTWVQFSEVFLGKYMPCSMREGLRDEFSRLRQGSMTVAEY